MPKFTNILVAKKWQFLGKAYFTNELSDLQESNGSILNLLNQGKAFNGEKLQENPQSTSTHTPTTGSLKGNKRHSVN